MISLASDVIVGLSAAFVAAMAFLGLSTWRKEIAGKAKFEIARNIILLGLKLDADWRWVRHPLSRAWECPTSSKNKKED